MVGVVGDVLEWVVGLCQAVELVFASIVVIVVIVVIIVVIVVINTFIVVVILFDCLL